MDCQQPPGAVEIGGEAGLDLCHHRQPPLDFGHDALLKLNPYQGAICLRPKIRDYFEYTVGFHSATLHCE
jgi:hypothetical protein